jgi:hypothetical protein
LISPSGTTLIRLLADYLFFASNQQMDPGNETSDFWSGYAQRSGMLQPMRSVRSVSQSNGISLTKIALITFSILSVLAISVTVANLIILLRNSNALKNLSERV